MAPPPYYRSLQLHDAIDLGLHAQVKFHLADPEVDIEYEHEDYTPFQHACYVGDRQIVQLFLDCGRPIDYNRTTNAGTSCLSFVISRPKILRMLVEDPRFDVNAITTSKRNYLHTVCRIIGHIDATKILLACGRFKPENAVSRDDNQKTPSDYLRGLPLYLEGYVALIDAFIKDPVGIRYLLREELGGYPEFNAGELFAIVVLLCDDYLELKRE